MKAIILTQSKHHLSTGKHIHKIYFTNDEGNQIYFYPEQLKEIGLDYFIYKKNQEILLDSIKYIGFIDEFMKDLQKHFKEILIINL